MWAFLPNAAMRPNQSPVQAALPEPCWEAGPTRYVGLDVHRNFLVAVWHVLSEQTGDRRADAVNVAKSLYKLAYRMGVRNLPEGMSARAFTRIQLDRLGLGAELTHLPWSGKRYKLPPSLRARPEPGG
jgi:hypothetical protein